MLSNSISYNNNSASVACNCWKRFSWVDTGVPLTVIYKTHNGPLHILWPWISYLAWMWSNRCCQRSLTSCSTPWILASLAWSLAKRSCSPSRLRWLLFLLKRLISSMQSYRDTNSEPQLLLKRLWGCFLCLTNPSQTKPWFRPSSCQNSASALSRISY